MATLALATAGAAVGGAVLPAGISVFGVTIAGATLGSQIGALAGSYIDQELFGSSGDTTPVEGPRLSEIHITSSSEGAAIPRIYGRVRLGAQVIWATDFEEEAVTTEAGGGGKGSFGGGISSREESRTDYIYFANFAVAICEGEITALGRVWADGVELDLSQYTYRLYRGTETQQADGFIAARLGAGQAPAYRGTAYIVFERMPLANFGNRLPQLSFEVYRAVEDFGEQVQGIVMIPGSGEFVYATQPVLGHQTFGESVPENVHTRQAQTDWHAAVDQLEATLPNAKTISLVVSWFGTDLRAGHCEVRPGVEDQFKDNGDVTWHAGGAGRAEALEVSRRDGRPAYGGTPADFAVIQSIRDLKTRNFKVVLTPFVLMDVPEGNSLPHPYGGVSQPAYPWRGRITVDPAPGLTGSPDKTAVAAAQIQSFVGTAQTSDFSIVNDTVVYSGPQEWSYRRMVLHQAFLAKAAGGVDAFLIGTELRGLTWVRDGAASYPFVQALVQLAADVKTVLGAATKVSYAADWSEYFGHQPQDGSGDVYFHLDPLWSSNDIDAVGIDCYWPLADWRDGLFHLDYQSGVRSSHDVAYLANNVRGGEGFDWYYASQSDRDAQVRTPITDGAGKPWVFRYKDVQAWWSNQHFNRPGGVEATSPTGWVAQSKPIWLMEIGCPAADKGANQPNVFVDPKSSESFLPYYSNGVRDDLMQRRYLEALIGAFDSSSENYVSGSNPISSVYGDRMVPLDRIFVYCWDARPYPAFPYNTDVWGDGENWRLGHWLTGRFSGAPLSEVVASMLRESGFENFDVGGLVGTVPGYLVDRPMAVRDALQPLGLAYFFDALETGGRVVFRHRGVEPPQISLTEEEFVEASSEAALATYTRGQETDLPSAAKLTYISTTNDYQRAVAESRRLTGASGRLSQAQLPIVFEAEQVSQIADTWLYETWAARERVEFSLPPSLLAVEAGDVLNVTREGRQVPIRVTAIRDGGARAIEARTIDRNVYAVPPAAARPARSSQSVAVGPAEGILLDLPLLPGSENENIGFFVAARKPWPGGVSLYASPVTTGYRLRAIATREAVIGETQTVLSPGPLWRFDYATRLQVKVSGELVSVEPTQLFAGRNAVAVQNTDGAWEIIQFERAELIGTGMYELSHLLRGQAGTQREMLVGASVGANFVLLNEALTNVNLTESEQGLPLNWRYGPANRDVGDQSYRDSSHAYQLLGARPYAPVHVRGRRVTDGLEVSWIRRTRLGGDSWEAVDVPLGEAVERYEIDVMDGTTVVRTLESFEPHIVYTDADQISDFGAVASEVSVCVYQMSATWGRGSAAKATVS